MKRNSDRHGKRRGATAMAACLLLQSVAAPAYATVSQLPGLFITPPDANVMFTLDDSLSMLSDAIPDFIADQTGMPNADGLSTPSDALSGAAGQQRARFPGMWKQGTLYLSTTFYRDDNKIARYLRSAAGNPLYYNRSVVYAPWPSAADDKVPMANATAGAVNIHPTDPTNSTWQVDLTTRRVESGSASSSDDQTKNFWPATYYVYSGASKLPFATPNTALNTASNFNKVEIKPGVTGYYRDVNRSDCSGVVGSATGCTYSQELQNFANWLQYYRSRMLMAKGGVAAAFAQQLSNLRVGLGSINSGGTVRQGVETFAGSRRTSFFSGLYGIQPSGGGTQLRRAMDDVGKYFQRSNVGNPWAENPASTTTVGKEYTCRRSFHILSTDGYWNGNGASGSAANDNDTFSGQTPAKPSGTTYLYSNTGATADPLVGRFTVDPFKDGGAATLADVAAYYWKTDLRTDLDNEGPSSIRDPAFWQHVTTHTVGLGVSGTGLVKRTYRFGTTVAEGSTTVPLTEPSTSPFYRFVNPPPSTGVGPEWLSSQELIDALIANKVPMTWTTPIADSAETGDDLVHASMTGRGKYYSAADPSSLRIGLAAALAEAADTPNSMANVVTQSPQVAAGSAVYQATYNPAQWSGRLYAFGQAANGSVDSAPGSALWEASNKMPSPANRNIFTWNPTTKGNPFTWAGLSAAQQLNLGSSSLLDWLRGSDVNEASKGGTFRDRARYTVGGVTGGVLGDVVNGSPIKGPSFGGGYNRLPTGSPGQGTYAAYRDTNNTALDSMRNTIYLGANDGMLHAFDRSNGVERFAFVPNAVFNVPRSATLAERKLKLLADPGYTHRFTVDGPPQIADAFIGTAGLEAWKTVLLGSTGAGARSVFAVDVTNPAVASGGFDQSKLMWEFSEANNIDMGYVTGYPHIARMRNGAWVAIFGNGYDSASGQAKLFVLDLQTGAVLWQRSVGAAGGNGLSQPNFIVNNNREVTAIFAGDLKGNVWKFDVDSADTTQWKVAFGGAPDYAPLFTGSVNQPITVMPELTMHPNGGTMVSFGTGSLFQTEDTAATGNVNLNTQALYGIWDKPGQTAGFSGNTLLVLQGANTALASAADAAANVTGTTSNSIDWGSKRGWYLQLGAGNGERVNVNPLQVNSVLLAVSNRPDSDPCKSGGSSRLFVLDPVTGGAPGFAVLDSNGVGGVTGADKGYNVKSFSFGVMSLPTLQSKKPASDGVTSEKAGTRGQTGARAGGVDSRPVAPTDCAQWLLAGGSNTSIAGLDVSTCNSGTPRISWRQLK